MSKKLGVTKNILRVGAKSSSITNVSHSKQIPRTRLLTLRVRVNFLPQTEPNSFDSLGSVKVSQHVDTEKCDEVNNINHLVSGSSCVLYFVLFL
jgi:hypothetical protein